MSGDFGRNFYREHVSTRPAPHRCDVIMTCDVIYVNVSSWRRMTFSQLTNDVTIAADVIKILRWQISLKRKLLGFFYIIRNWRIGSSPYVPDSNAAGCRPVGRSRQLRWTGAPSGDDSDNRPGSSRRRQITDERHRGTWRHSTVNEISFGIKTTMMTVWKFSNDKFQNTRGVVYEMFQSLLCHSTGNIISFKNLIDDLTNFSFYKFQNTNDASCFISFSYILDLVECDHPFDVYLIFLSPDFDHKIQDGSSDHHWSPSNTGLAVCSSNSRQSRFLSRVGEIRCRLSLRVGFNWRICRIVAEMKYGASFSTPCRTRIISDSRKFRSDLSADPSVVQNQTDIWSDSVKGKSWT